MATLNLRGADAAGVECLQSLKPGRRILLWYSDDDVWHEAMIGVVANSELAVIYTPDGDLYLENLTYDPVSGPVKLRSLKPNMTLPRNLRASAYRFKGAISDEKIKSVFRESLKLVEDEGIAVQMPDVTDVQCGDRTALALRQGVFVKVEMIRTTEAIDYADKRRSLFAESKAAKDAADPSSDDSEERHAAEWAASMERFKDLEKRQALEKRRAREEAAGA
eukprot:Skav200683  [mRNA]  locus=scaffold1446:222610:229350:+ [translate_table: standard]